MNISVELVSQLLAISTIVGQLLIVGTIGLLLFSKIFHKKHPILDFLAHYQLHLITLIAFASILGSLYYSNIANFAPCTLCWWQRVFIYPQFFIGFIAIIRRDHNLAPYLLFFSLAALALAIYHYAGQLGLTNLAVCDVNISCSERFVFQFNFISIPLMSVTAMFLSSLLASLKLLYHPSK